MCKIFHFLLQTILFFHQVIYGSEQHWDYTGKTDPKHWNELKESHCGSSRQSPINITDAKHWAPLKTPKLQENTSAVGEYKIINNGHSVVLTVPSKSWYVFYPHTHNTNPACIAVDGIHWHWGKTNDFGSEHLHHGKSYPIEGHMVCWNCNNFPDIESAKKNPEGLFVFGFFYELTDAKSYFNQQLDDVTSQFPRLFNVNATNEMKTITISHVDISKLLPSDLSKYYRYEGSLTTPPCTENVIWTIFHTPTFMTYSQIDFFHKYLFFPDGRPMANNYRPVQNLNSNEAQFVKREIYSSFLENATLQSVQVNFPFLFMATISMACVELLKFLIFKNY